MHEDALEMMFIVDAAMFRMFVCVVMIMVWMAVGRPFLLTRCATCGVEQKWGIDAAIVAQGIAYECAETDEDKDNNEATPA